MILTPHILAGAAIGSRIENPAVVAFFAFLSHYALDALPHNFEYDISNIKTGKVNKRFIIDLIKVFIDLVIAISIVLILSYKSENLTNILVGAISAGLPDFCIFLHFTFKTKFLEVLSEIHQAIHIFKYKKVAGLARIATQFIVVAVSILVLIT